MKQVVRNLKKASLPCFWLSVLILAYLCLSDTAYAQQGDELTDKIYLNALQYTNGAHKPYNPEKALNIMTSLANEGVPKAMNALGIMYANGKGTEADYRAAITWFKKAAEAGHLRSYYNWSLMWKYGFGVEKNDTEAYYLLRKGADAGEPNCQYGVGYAHYKGMGCIQDYRLAIEYFRGSAESFNSGATYMIGLCLLNGYGFERDTAQARKWLQISEKSGNARAAIELRTEKPENYYNTAGMISGKRYRVANPETLRKVEPDSMGSVLSRRFEGYVIRYDWSREYIIKISPLTLTLSADGNLITGRWLEDDTITAELKAELKDTLLTFIDVGYTRPDHYHPEPFRSEFKTAHINLSTDGASVYLTGSLQLFSDITMEPMQPVSLHLKSAVERGSGSQAVGQGNAGAKLIGFLDPFNGEFCLGIDLEEEADVHAELLTNSGTLLMEADCGRLLPGRNIVTMPASVAKGFYLVRIRCGNEEALVTVVKP